MFHKKAGAGTGQTGPRSSHAEILTWTAAADDVHRQQFRPVQFRDVPNMNHARETVFCNFDGEGFDLAGPQWRDPIADRRQRKTADPIEQASHCEHFHLLQYRLR
ncbi:MAG: hypothetical protein K2P04_04245 [Oscillospiraceae bacterium]|nr:hypothetical protein [Oscillospiraceae bacterium]